MRRDRAEVEHHLVTSASFALHYGCYVPYGLIGSTCPSTMHPDPSRRHGESEGKHATHQIFAYSILLRSQLVFCRSFVSKDEASRTPAAAHLTRAREYSS